MTTLLYKRARPERLVTLAYEFLVRPLLPWLLTVAGAADVPPLPSLDAVLFELVFGMLGLGTLRTADRWKRVSAIVQK